MAAKKDLPMLPATTDARADCAWEGCRQKAATRDEIEPGKGRHNLCEYHYIEAHKLRAQRWCEARGLLTVENKRDYCRNLIAGLIKPMPLVDREPGQDDEERRGSSGISPSIGQREAVS